ncbi:MAG: hypothetical protein FJ222_01810 [Lentisphaerae bacterium]|nr:hypothetical protein [Lentisphaerota bacterium]
MGRFIIGIYNYCDYWCERCAFTRRCRNYNGGSAARRLKAAARDEDRDAVNASFWNDLAERLRDATIFGSMADDAGCEADDADVWGDSVWADEGGGAETDSRIDAAMDARDRAVKAHPLTHLSRDYMMRAGQWLKDADADLKGLAAEWLAQAGSRYDDTDYEEAAHEVGDLVEVVNWYHTLIPPKLARALGNLAEPVLGDGEYARIIRESRLSDANGSGKVALIAVERSIAAWLRLRELLPRQEDAILALLVLLGRLQRGIRTAIPGAEAFKRPGFDPGSTCFADDESN